MGPADVRPALAGFREKVTDLTEEGLPLGDVQNAIDAQAALTEDQKAALWLFAYSLRDRSDKQRQARALSGVPGVAPGAGRHSPRRRETLSGSARAAERARPREFDSRGFPVPQRNRSFLERVARLLNPD